MLTNIGEFGWLLPVVFDLCGVQLPPSSLNLESEQVWSLHLPEEQTNPVRFRDFPLGEAKIALPTLYTLGGVYGVQTVRQENRETKKALQFMQHKNQEVQD